MTPMMQQYKRIKEQYENAILFFRLGDFYEMFFEDAVVAAKELEIALTRRDMGGGETAPMCGVPHHSSEPYIARLVERGYRVAICEQMEDPKAVKGIVPRDVVRVVTPGTFLKDRPSENSKNNYLLCIRVAASGFGLAAVDIATGEIHATQYDGMESDWPALLADEIAKWNPSELLIENSLYQRTGFVAQMEERYGAMINLYDPFAFGTEDDAQFIRQQMPSVKASHPVFTHDAAASALASLLRYLYHFENRPLPHLDNVEWFEVDHWMGLDQNTRTHLDIHQPQRSQDRKHTLFYVLNKTTTAMGGRKLHRFLERPLRSIERLQHRQNRVARLMELGSLRMSIQSHLRGVYDLDRLLAKLSYQRANARDLIALRDSLASLPALLEAVRDANDDVLEPFLSAIDPLDDVTEEIRAAIHEEAPILLTEGNLIRTGYNEELDELRETSLHGQDRLVEYELEQREKTGIRTLKVIYHKNKGYSIDVTKSYFDRVPDTYRRLQTLTNSERYITDEILEIQDMIRHSEEETRELEYQLFLEVRNFILDRIDRIRSTSQSLAEMDVYCSLAQVACEENYVLPTFHEDREIRIEGGRHPVVEKALPIGNFVANDTEIGSDENRIQILTGPNMSGKSTFMRQVALIQLMAQIGSAVPAQSAQLPIVDKIFTRIGASDHLAAGDSTFMVEMREMSYILRHATKDSLLILDEIGRGTSTYDGMSIAWAILEYIAEAVDAKTMFATHYHELTGLADHYPTIRNYTVAVREEKDRIVFLRTILPGQTDRSYGIEVARMADFPEEILLRAREILSELEWSRADIHAGHSGKSQETTAQIDFADLARRSLIEHIGSLPIDTLSPLDALNLLNTLRAKARALEEDNVHTGS